MERPKHPDFDWGQRFGEASYQGVSLVEKLYRVEHAAENAGITLRASDLYFLGAIGESMMRLQQNPAVLLQHYGVENADRVESLFAKTAMELEVVVMPSEALEQELLRRKQDALAEFASAMAAYVQDTTTPPLAENDKQSILANIAEIKAYGAAGEWDELHWKAWDILEPLMDGRIEEKFADGMLPKVDILLASPEDLLTFDILNDPDLNQILRTDRRRVEESKDSDGIEFRMQVADPLQILESAYVLVRKLHEGAEKYDTLISPFSASNHTHFSLWGMSGGKEVDLSGQGKDGLTPIFQEMCNRIMHVGHTLSAFFFPARRLFDEDAVMVVHPTKTRGFEDDHYTFVRTIPEGASSTTDGANAELRNPMRTFPFKHDHLIKPMATVLMGMADVMHSPEITRIHTLSLHREGGFVEAAQAIRESGQLYDGLGGGDLGHRALEAVAQAAERLAKSFDRATRLIGGRNEPHSR